MLVVLDVRQTVEEKIGHQLGGGVEFRNESSGEGHIPSEILENRCAGRFSLWKRGLPSHFAITGSNT